MELNLTPGHIHEGAISDGVVVWIYATPWPELWHLFSRRKQATQEPVPTDQVAALLESWNFTTEYWSHWPGPLDAVNPALEVWEGLPANRAGIMKTHDALARRGPYSHGVSDRGPLPPTSTAGPR